MTLIYLMQYTNSILLNDIFRNYFCIISRKRMGFNVILLILWIIIRVLYFFNSFKIMYITDIIK